MFRLLRTLALTAALFSAHGVFAENLAASSSGSGTSTTTMTTCTPDTVTYVTNPMTTCSDHVQSVTNGVNTCNMTTGAQGQAADFSAKANCAMGSVDQVVTTCDTTEVTTAKTVKGVCTTTTSTSSPLIYCNQGGVGKAQSCGR